MKDFLEDLRWRGLLEDSSAGLEETLGDASDVIAYIGFDPTATSLHIGSLLPILTLARLQRFGHRPIALVGGGTGMVGDPSGKASERSLLDDRQLQANLSGLRRQLEHYLAFDGDRPAVLLDNADWLRPMTLIDFLRDVGKHFTVNTMLAKESVKRRIEGQGGISFTEFSYSILQAYDFLHLFDHHGCRLQMGGSDQWGNIVAGIELVRRTRGAHAHGLTFPLVTTRAGTKFGKTEAGTVWLDAELTSPYQFYQFWLNTEDQDAVKYLKFFTFLERSRVDELSAASKEAPQERAAQRALADEVTRMTHGQDGLDVARRLTDAFFGGDLSQLGADDLADVLSEAPSALLDADRLDGDGMSIIDLLVHAGAASSKADAKRTLAGGGVYLRDPRIEELGRRVTRHDALEDRLIVLRKGRKSYFLVRLHRADA